MVLAARQCHVSVLRVLLQEYQARDRLKEALERSCVGKEVHPLLFACVNNLDIEEGLRLATTRLFIEEFQCQRPGSLLGG